MQERKPISTLCLRMGLTLESIARPFAADFPSTLYESKFFGKNGLKM